jgi:ATP-dependent Clp protease ATP-binding subunit ClpA
MLYEWWRLGLANILPLEQSDQAAELLDYKILDDFKKSENYLLDLLGVIKKQNGYWFMANRLAIQDNMLERCDIVLSSDEFLKELIKLWQEYYDEDGIDSAHIFVGLILNSTNKKDMLLGIKCNEQDLLSCLKWYLYVKKTLRTLKERRDSGGIGRDWAAGYTPLLNRYGRNLSYDIKYGGILKRQHVLHQDVISQLLSIFGSSGRANCALVGDIGVGKTTCIQRFAEQLLFGDAPQEVKYNQIYLIDISSITSSGSVKNMDFMITNMFLEAYKAKNIILYFSNSEQLFNPSNSGQDLSDTLLPIIQGGRVKTIFAFTPKAWQYLERNKPAVASVLNYQIVSPPSKEDTLLILENQSLFIEQQYKCIFTYKSLQETYKLAERYGPDISMPSKAISVLESAGRQNQKSLITEELVQKSIEATTGVKISIAGGRERGELLDLEDKIKQRVIGQDQAVKEVVSALKRSRAGVANSKKPIGTFLFLGPTGVGKTELSKSLAWAYFGGEGNMIRLDMNEYILKDSIHKLLSINGQSAPTFIDQIRRNPFSVVLLDEIEKAHPDIKNVFLQMLDEGVIKDEDNHNISFKDAIIIATSNAGADEIRQSISSGKTLLPRDLITKLIEEGSFKPEFLNRFDSTIIFSPLEPNNLKSIVRIIISDINKGLESQQITVNLTDKAIDWLSSNGYDVMLGARPLRRLVQQTVENALSNKILSNQVQSGDNVLLDENDLTNAVK